MKKWVSVNLLQESSRRTRVTKRRGELRSSIDDDDGTCLYIICGRHLDSRPSFFSPFSLLYPPIHIYVFIYSLGLIGPNFLFFF